LAPGTRVTIERRGDVLTVRPRQDSEDQKARIERLVARLRAIGPAETIERHEGFDAIERPGMI
jgi:hypothetical protein